MTLRESRNGGSTGPWKLQERCETKVSRLFRFSINFIFNIILNFLQNYAKNIPINFTIVNSSFLRFRCLSKYVSNFIYIKITILRLCSRCFSIFRYFDISRSSQDGGAKERGARRCSKRSVFFRDFSIAWKESRRPKDARVSLVKCRTSKCIRDRVCTCVCVCVRLSGYRRSGFVFVRWSRASSPHTFHRVVIFSSNCSDIGATITKYSACLILCIISSK